MNWRCCDRFVPCMVFSSAMQSLHTGGPLLWQLLRFFIITFPQLHYLLQLPLTGRVSESYLTLPRLTVAKALFFTSKRVPNSSGNHSQLRLKWQSVCLDTPQLLAENRVSIPGEANEFILCSKRPRPALEVTQHPVHRYPANISPSLPRWGCVADHSSPSIAELPLQPRKPS